MTNQERITAIKDQIKWLDSMAFPSDWDEGKLLMRVALMEERNILENIENVEYLPTSQLGYILPGGK